MAWRGGKERRGEGRRKGVLNLMPSILAGAAGVSVAKGKERGRKDGGNIYYSPAGQVQMRMGR